MLCSSLLSSPLLLAFLSPLPPQLLACWSSVSRRVEYSSSSSSSSPSPPTPSNLRLNALNSPLNLELNSSVSSFHCPEKWLQWITAIGRSPTHHNKQHKLDKMIWYVGGSLHPMVMVVEDYEFWFLICCHESHCFFILNTPLQSIMLYAPHTHTHTCGAWSTNTRMDGLSKFTIILFLKCQSLWAIIHWHTNLHMTWFIAELQD